MRIARTLTGLVTGAMLKKYYNREEAGKKLAACLVGDFNPNNTIVLALPRGGVPVGYEIAKALHLPLDVFIVRKLGTPGHEELAMGAIASGDTIIFNKELINTLHIKEDVIDLVLSRERKELLRRDKLYRGAKPFPKLQHKQIILVDDGIATGSTILAAIKALKKEKPKSIIVAVPVAAHSTCDEIEPLVDQLICPLRPVDFYAVGLWYDNFLQTTDEDVIQLLNQARVC